MFDYDKKIKETNSPAWGLYNDLVSTVPSDSIILDAAKGKNWTFMESKDGLGVSHTFRPFEHQEPIEPKDLIGKPVKEAAELIYSWNFDYASFGMSAINIALNTPEREKLLKAEVPLNKKEDTISKLMPKFEGKRVAIVGHFPKVERYAENHDLFILELAPSVESDVFTSASEYILPSCDLVMMTGMTLANKTAPRLLELSKNACVALVGPSVPVSEVLFDYGVDVIASSVAHDINRTKELILDPSVGKLFGEAFNTTTVKRPGFTW